MPRYGNAMLAAGLLSALTLLAYSNSFTAGFQLDDYHQVVMNQHIRDIANLPRFFVDASMGSYDPTLMGYRPMTHASFAVNYLVSGYRVWSYHLMNAALHAINAFLVYLVVGQVMKEAGKESFHVPLLTALLFAAHPIATSSVTYVSGRAALLATLFYLLALLSFMRYRGQGGWYWAALSPVLYLSGLLTKEMAVSLPALLIAYDLLFTAPKRGGVSKSLDAGICYAPFLFALGAYLWARRHFAGFFVEPPLELGVGTYLMSEAHALLIYLRLLLLPVNQNADYNIPHVESPDAAVAVSALLVVAAAFAIYRLARTNRPAAFFGLWFFIALIPESTLVPIPDAVEEYRLYLPAAGFVAAAVMLADGLLVGRRAAWKAFAVTLLTMLCVLTLSRNRVWATDYTFWSDIARKSPESARAHAYLGIALGKEGRYMESIGELGRTLEMDPDFNQKDTVHNNIAKGYLAIGMREDAMRELKEAVEANPRSFEAYSNMGALLNMTGRYREAADALRKSVDIAPGFTPAHLELALAYARLGRPAESAAEAETSIGQAPKDFVVRYNAALAFSVLGMRDRAVGQARLAAQLAEDAGQRKDAEGLVERLGGKGQGR